MAFRMNTRDGMIVIRKFRLQLPRRTRSFPFNRILKEEEYRRASRGLMPLGPEDKWLVLHRDGEFSFCRSGSGVLLYRVKFDGRRSGYFSSRATVNDDSRQIQPQPDSYEACLLDYLIDRLLLGEKSPFPAPPGVDPDRAVMLERLWMGRFAGN